MGNGEFPVKVVVMLSLHVSREIVAWDDGICLKDDTYGIVCGGPSGNNL